MTDVALESLLSAFATLKSICTERAAAGDISKSQDAPKWVDAIEHNLSTVSDYATKDRSLTYVSFVGHWNAGKSTLINALLESDGFQKASKTRQDRDLTFITAPQNVEKIAVTRSTKIASIIREHKHRLLKTLVLVDTPGSGDKTVLQSLVRDHLPISNVIVYVFSANLAGDDADDEVLSLVAKELSFKRRWFVVTHYWAFRKNENEPMTDLNFAREEYEKTAASVVSRLVGEYGFKGVTASDLIFVDSKQGYNVDKLRDQLAALSINAATEHSNNIALFTARFNEARDGLLSFFKALQQDATNILDKAESNQRQFERVAEVRSDALFEHWSDTAEAIRETASDSENQIREWLDSASKATQKLVDIKRRSSVGPAEELELLADRLADTSIRDLRDSYRQCLARVAGDLAKLTPKKARTTPLSLPPPESGHIMSPESAARARREIAATLAEHLGRVESSSQDCGAFVAAATDGMSEHRKANKIQAVESKAHSDEERIVRELSGDLKNAVRAYKATVFSYSMRALSNRLSVAEFLDSQDVKEVSDEDLESVRRGAFQDREQRRVDGRRKFTEEMSSASQAIGSLVQRKDEATARLSSKLDVEDISEGAWEKITSKLTEAVASVAQQRAEVAGYVERQARQALALHWQQADTDYSSSLSRSRYRRGFLIWAVVCTLLLTAASGLLYWLAGQVPISVIPAAYQPTILYALSVGIAAVASALIAVPLNMVLGEGISVKRRATFEEKALQEAAREITGLDPLAGEVSTELRGDLRRKVIAGLREELASVSRVATAKRVDDLGIVEKLLSDFQAFASNYGRMNKEFVDFAHAHYAGDAADKTLLRQMAIKIRVQAIQLSLDAITKRKAQVDEIVAKIDACKA